MAHLRKQIRDAAQTATTGLATTGSNVFPGRVHNLAAGDLPALLIYATSEQAEIISISRPRTALRDLEIVFEGRAQAATAEALEDLLDTIALEVETALGDTTLGGLVKNLDLASTEIQASGAGQKLDGMVRLTYRAVYAAALDDPETAN